VERAESALKPLTLHPRNFWFVHRVQAQGSHSRCPPPPVHAELCELEKQQTAEQIATRMEELMGQVSAESELVGQHHTPWDPRLENLALLWLPPSLSRSAVVHQNSTLPGSARASRCAGTLLRAKLSPTPH
jgi:hypothetical protein